MSSNRSATVCPKSSSYTVRSGCVPSCSSACSGLSAPTSNTASLPCAARQRQAECQAMLTKRPSCSCWPCQHTHTHCADAAFGWPRVCSSNTLSTAALLHAALLGQEVKAAVHNLPASFVPHLIPQDVSQVHCTWVKFAGAVLLTVSQEYRKGDRVISWVLGGMELRGEEKSKGKDKGRGRDMAA